MKFLESLLVFSALLLLLVPEKLFTSAAPQYHLYAPGHWMGHPSAPLRWRNGRVEFFAEYNENITAATPRGWVRMTSLNYTVWRRDASPLPPNTSILSAGNWYNEEGSFAGSATISASGDAVVAYTCVGSSGIPRVCLSRPIKPPSSSSLFDRSTDVAQSAWNPVLGPNAAWPTSHVVNNYFRDPTRWWREDGDTWALGVAVQDESQGAAVAVFRTQDPSLQQGYEWSNILYSDGNFSAFGTPDFFSLGDANFLKLTMLGAGRDYVVYGVYKNGLFEEDVSRPPTFVDLGLLVHSKTFWDPITRSQRLWGYIPEDLVEPSQAESQGYAGVASTLRVVTYNQQENRLAFAPQPELKALRVQKIFSSTNFVLERTKEEEDTVTRPLPLLSDATPHHEIRVEFQLPAGWMEGRRAADPPEVGVLLRSNENFTKFTSVSLQMVTQASCEASGGVGDGVRFRSIPLFDEFNDSDVALCNRTCSANTMCDRWDAVLMPYGIECNLYTLSTERHSGEVCGTQSGCPLLSPLLVVDRTQSGTAGNSTVLRGRADVRRGSPATVTLHIFVDDSVVEVFKDDGLESLTSRLYLPRDQNGLGLFVRNLPVGEKVAAKVRVFTMGKIWSPETGESDIQRKINEYTDAYGEMIQA